jgi:hypothetical protein
MKDEGANVVRTKGEMDSDPISRGLEAIASGRSVWFCYRIVACYSPPGR